MANVILNGKKFNEKYAEFNFIQLLGHNIDLLNSNSWRKYFILVKDVGYWVENFYIEPQFYRFVEIPNGAAVTIYSENTQYGAYSSDILISSEKKHIWTDEEMCERILSSNGFLLKFIPHNNRNEHMCKIAVAEIGYALKYVPSVLLTEEMCEIGLKKSGCALQYIDKQTEKICRMAILQQGMALEYVKPEFYTEELCKIAVGQNGFALRYVSTEFKTSEMCEIAVLQNGNKLQHVPPHLKTRHICDMATSTYPCSVLYSE